MEWKTMRKGVESFLTQHPFWITRLRQTLVFSSQLPGVLQRKFPIDQFIQHSGCVVCPSILIIKVVSVFPHVNGEQRFHSGCQGSLSIGGFYHLELTPINNQPRPTASRTGQRRQRQIPS